MTRRFFYTLLFFATLLTGTAHTANITSKTASGAHPMVTLTTNHGDIVLELDEAKAPISVKNFLGYVDAGFYDGLIFHRVIPGFMIQGGGMTPDMREKRNNDPIKNEADNGLLNSRGTIAMARTQVVDSATSQFFINLADNAFLNHGKRDFGYAVFGRVASGMEVVEKIAAIKTGNNKGHGDVPIEPVIILKAQRT
ncbi:MAG: peptidylprolyl isomerase [Magnetococcales bacterium]|nr:peptidylprolyl isomerase [Magnetococcales bacterium]